MSLHWHWVVAVTRGRSRQTSMLRLALAIVAIMALCSLAVAPFPATVRHQGEPPHRLRATESGQAEPHGSTFPDRAAAYRMECDGIDGTMTLSEVEQSTGVPMATILRELGLRELGLPGELPADSRLGRLRRVHGFDMYDVREIVREHASEG